MHKSLIISIFSCLITVFSLWCCLSSKKWHCLFLSFGKSNSILISVKHGIVLLHKHIPQQEYLFATITLKIQGTDDWITNHGIWFVWLFLGHLVCFYVGGGGDCVLVTVVKDVSAIMNINIKGFRKCNKMTYVKSWKVSKSSM